MHKIDPELVNAGVSKHWMDSNMLIIKAIDCQNREHEDSFCEFKVLKGLLLVIKHVSGSKLAQKVYSGSMYHFNNNMSK